MPIAIEHKTHVLTVLNLKGGVGKTHASWLLASVCQERERRLLAVDLNAQGNFTSSFFPSADGKPGVECLFNPASEIESKALIRHTAFSSIDLIPSGPRLAPFDLSNQREWERADLHLSLVDAMRELRRDYDVIVFDCPPRLSLVSFAALCASDAVIIPMEAADWGAQGIMQVTAAIEYVQKHSNPSLRLLGYLVSRFKKARSYQRAYLSELQRQFGNLAFDTVLPDLSAFEQSVTNRIPITSYRRSSRAASIARAFVDEVERRLAGTSDSSFGRREECLQQTAAAVAR